jgi:anti-anti-sigma factor
MHPTVEMKVGRLSDGYVVQIHGRATLRESPALQSFVKEAFAQGCGRLVVDLSECESLDSTFQGCLLSLARRCGRSTASHFEVAEPSAESRRMLAASHLIQFLPLVDAAPTPIGETTPLPSEDVDARTLGEHILDCHRRLAEVGPSDGKFRRVIEQLERELQAGKSS